MMPLLLWWLPAACINQTLEDTTCYYDEFKRAEQTCLEYGGEFQGESVSGAGHTCDSTLLPSGEDIQECLVVVSETCTISCTLSGQDTGGT